MDEHSGRATSRPRPTGLFRGGTGRSCLDANGLALMGFGFVVARFGLFLREIAAAGQVVAHQHSTGWSLWIGTAPLGWVWPSA